MDESATHQWKPGTQVAYIPDHANGNIEHADCEFGFVTSGSGAQYQCRFFQRGRRYLRTHANSESCLTRNLVEHQSADQPYVDRLLKDLGYGHATHNS